MDVILDESSLTHCNNWSPAFRIKTLASALKALDKLGCARELRSVHAAADQDIGQGRGLRGWCFDRDTDRDVGRFIAQRLGRQPFIDGIDGLFAAAEGERAIEGTALDINVIGLAFAALTGSPAVALGSAVLSTGTIIPISLTTLDAEGEFQESISVCCVVTEDDVRQQRDFILERIERAVSNGGYLLGHATELFPRLRFGSRAVEQIAVLTGTEPVFHQLFRHLQALNQGADEWQLNAPYVPVGAISWSSESNSTLGHGRYGPLRDFPMPVGYSPQRWSHHTKLSGGAGARLYFHAERTSDGPVVLVGYFGPHLPTVLFSG